MAKTSINLQDSFLNQVRKDNVEIQLVLLDGSTLLGHVRGFDNFTVIVNGPQAQHLIYKHAIAHVVSQRRMAEGDHAPREPREHRPEQSRNPENRGGEHRNQPPHGDQRQGAEGRGDQRRPPRDALPAGNPRPPREQDNAEKSGPKFNSLDLSSVQIDGETK